MTFKSEWQAMSGPAFAVLLLLLLVSTQKAARLKGLKCYQCVTDNRHDDVQLCDSWTLTTKKERASMEILCPKSKSAFCVTKVEVVDDFRNTSRGCQGDKDKAGNALSSGCMTLYDSEKDSSVSMCMCEESLCNAATTPTAALLSRLLPLVVPLVKMLLR